MKAYDLLIVGAGPVGCVIAERAASQRGWNCLVIDKRKHVAGNCFDTSHKNGVLVHQYGPHYFRSDNRTLLDYLSQFTEWIPGEYIVKSLYRGQLYPFPVNLTTLEQFFKRTFSEQEARDFIDAKREKIAEPKNSEEFVLSRVGRELYEAFYLGYTLKQWDIHPRDLDASVCGRIPVRFNRNSYYVDHANRLTPKLGFTAMFQKMLTHPKIEVRLQTDFGDFRGRCRPRIGTVYCGPADEYFDFKLGRLPWRSLEFRFEPHQKQFIQPCVQINYPNDYDYTRTVEIKHVTQQVHPETVVAYEYPRRSGDPYYPIPNPANRRLYQQYQELVDLETEKSKVYFVGRLAEYKYLNTDEAMEHALRTFDRIVLDAARHPVQTHPVPRV